MEQLFKWAEKLVDARLKRHDFVATIEKYNQASEVSKAKMLRSVSKVLAGVITGSAEFVLGFTLLFVFFVVTLPFGTSAMDNHLTARLIWGLGTIFFYFAVHFTLPFLISLRLTTLNLPVFFLVVSGVYASTAALFIYALFSNVFDPTLFDFAQMVLFMSMFISILVLSTLIANARYKMLIADKTSGGSVFFGRLPHHIRGRLILMQTNDHYLNITTEKGEALIRLSLQEAVDLLDGHIEGVRVHRSHWVSMHILAACKFDATKRNLTLPTGQIVPVAKNRVNELIRWLTVVASDT